MRFAEVETLQSSHSPIQCLRAAADLLRTHVFDIGMQSAHAPEILLCEVGDFCAVWGANASSSAEPRFCKQCIAVRDLGFQALFPDTTLLAAWLDEQVTQPGSISRSGIPAFPRLSLRWNGEQITESEDYMFVDKQFNDVQVQKIIHGRDSWQVCGDCKLAVIRSQSCQSKLRQKAV